MQFTAGSGSVLGAIQHVLHPALVVNPKKSLKFGCSLNKTISTFI
jgi:hypothetical protein